MILDRSIEAYSRTRYNDDEGIQQFTYSLAFTSRASVQPASLSEAQLAQWGITTLVADSRIMYVPGNPALPQGTIVKDLKTLLRYEVRNSNPWPNHSEVLLNPYPGTAPV